ncbi:hypothetical protein B0H19DRAFT_1240996 [Mycena capillaripes]|nr:hypothetical protein B0H19DRAFT_1240996 [Mycena capillaripes]
MRWENIGTWTSRTHSSCGSRLALPSRAAFSAYLVQVAVVWCVTNSLPGNDCSYTHAAIFANGNLLRSGYISSSPYSEEMTILFTAVFYTVVQVNLVCFLISLLRSRDQHETRRPSLQIALALFPETGTVAHHGRCNFPDHAALRFIATMSALALLLHYRRVSVLLEWRWLLASLNGRRRFRDSDHGSSEVIHFVPPGGESKGEMITISLSFDSEDSRGTLWSSSPASHGICSQCRARPVSVLSRHPRRRNVVYKVVRLRPKPNQARAKAMTIIDGRWARLDEYEGDRRGESYQKRRTQRWGGAGKCQPWERAEYLPMLGSAPVFLGHAPWRFYWSFTTDESATKGGTRCQACPKISAIESTMNASRSIFREAANKRHADEKSSLPHEALHPARQATLIHTPPRPRGAIGTLPRQKGGEGRGGGAPKTNKKVMKEYTVALAEGTKLVARMLYPKPDATNFMAIIKLNDLADKEYVAKVRSLAQAERRQREREEQEQEPPRMRIRPPNAYQLAQRRRREREQAEKENHNNFDNKALPNGLLTPPATLQECADECEPERNRE